ncbi:MAG: sulfate permease [Cyanobacteria bacterium P01_H01_bin.21]
MLSTPLGLKQLLSYQRPWLRGDILAGLTVAAYLIPQCMAYGELAGVQPVAGLWAILPAMVLYTLLGSSPQLSVGPESTTAVMTAVAIAPLTGSSDYAAALLALLVGLVYVVGYLARLGFLADLLSKPILIGYMTGVAVIMIAGQLGKISGVTIDAETVVGEIRTFVASLNQAHMPTLMLSVAVLIFLFVVQLRWPRLPGPLLAVLLATLVVTLFRLDQLGVAVVGDIPAGLPQLRLPPLQQMPQLMAAAVGIAVVGYSDNVLTARAFATRNGYKIDANQELLALGAVNIGAGLMQGFPVSSSGSRTVLGNALGNKTQLFSLVAMAAVVFVLVFLRPVLALFPNAALGALVIYAATRLIEISEFVRLLRFRSTEFALAIVTTVGVLATNLLVGIAIAISLSVIDLFARVARPHDAVLGKVLGLAGWHDIEDWDDATTIPGLVIYRYDAPICFANVENFKRRALAAIAAEQERVEWFVLNAEAIAEIDITAADMLAELYQELTDLGIVFALARVKQDLYTQLKRSGLRELIGNERIYPTLKTAIRGFEDRYRLR